MNKKKNLAFVGAGFIGQTCHIQNYFENSNCNLIALAEYKPKLRKLVAKKYNFKNHYSNHIEMLDSENNLDAVIVVTNRFLTASIVKDCLNRNLNVFAEKPIALNFHTAKQLVKISKRKNLILKIGYNKIYDEGVNLGKRIFNKLLTTKELGNLEFVRSHRFSGTGYCNLSGYIKTKEKINIQSNDDSPSFLKNLIRTQYLSYLNLYCHNINLLRNFLGTKPKIEYADINKNNTGIVILDFKGIKISLETKDYKDNFWDESFKFYFEKGLLEIKTPPQQLINVPSKVSLFKRTNKPIEIKPKSNFSWSFKNQSKAFIDDLKFNSCLINSGENSIIDIKIVEEIFKNINDK